MINFYLRLTIRIFEGLVVQSYIFQLNSVSLNQLITPTFHFIVTSLRAEKGKKSYQYFTTKSTNSAY